MSEVNRTKLGPASAYAIAVKNGFKGTEKEWLEYLACTEYADRTAEFQAQTQIAKPEEYLRSLGAGAWQAVHSDMLYRAKTLKLPTGVIVREEETYTDDIFLYRKIWIGDKLVYLLDTEVGGLEICGKKFSTEEKVQELFKKAADDKINILMDEIFTPGANLFNPNAAVKNRKLDLQTGEIVDAGTTHTVSDFIKIPPGESNITASYVTGGGVHQKQPQTVVYYDSSKSFVASNENCNNYAIPNGAKYFRLMLGNNFASALDRIMVAFGTELLEFCEYGEQGVAQRVSDLEERVESLETANTTPVLKLLFAGNKKIKLIGDSITQGVGGSGFAQEGELIMSTPDVEWRVNTIGVCWANMLKSYIEEKFPTCTVKNYGTKSESYHSMLDGSADKLGQLIEDDDDLVIMMFGTNDRIHNGSIAETIVDAEKVIEYISNTRGKQLILMSSIPASINDETMENKHFHMEDVDMVNSYLAEKYGLPVVSLYREFIRRVGLSGGKIDDYLADGLHPNDEGYGLMFEIVCDGLGIGRKRPDAAW